MTRWRKGYDEVRLQLKNALRARRGVAANTGAPQRSPHLVLVFFRSIQHARRGWKGAIFAVLFVAICIDFSQAQNIIDCSSTFLAANPAKLTETDFSEFIVLRMALQPATNSLVARRIGAKLEGHVAQFLDGWPWMPFDHTLGLSGYEVYFNHPDEMFYSLAVALPFLSTPLAEKTKSFLAGQLDQMPPYGLAGFDNRAGHPRESYDVPPGLRVAGAGKAACAFGVYAFWTYCQYAGNTAAARSNWPAVKDRMKPLLQADYHFDVAKTDYSHDEAEKLNGDLAGLIGLARLARMNGDAETEKAAVAHGTQLLELRINLERVNPHIVEKTSFASKSLHNFKLARYCQLVPEVGEALRKLSAGCAAGRLQAARQERNGWYLAYGDRLIGGENYTNPLHFPASLFSGAVLIEQAPAEQLSTWIDVPWCRGDYYFIEKCAYTLWTLSGREWSPGARASRPL